MNEHIEHFSINDGAYGCCFEKAFEFLDKCSFGELAIEDLIRLYVIKKYEDDYNYLTEEYKQKIELNKQKFKKIKIELNKYFKSVDDSIFERDSSILRKEEQLLTHDYLDAINEYFKYTSITFAPIKNAIINNLIPLYYVLYQNNICNAFEVEIKQFMLQDNTSIELLVTEFDENTRSTRRHYFLPRAFSESEIDLLIDNYLSNQYANFNVIKCLIYHKNSKDTYSISPLSKIKLKKRFKEMEDDLMNNHFIWGHDYEVRIDPTQDEPCVYKREKNNTLISYSGKWILEHTDYPTILNNLIYVFELVDPDFRFSSLPYRIDNSLLTDIFESKNKDEYGNMIFMEIDGTYNTSFFAYYKYLERKEIRLESVFEWFSKDYIKNEFNLSGFDISLPVSEEGYYLKCKNIFSEIDKILKAYMVYQKYGNVESDIFEEETLCKYQFLKSMNGVKYIYENETSEIKTIMFYLFSSQSMLHYINTDKKDRSFYKLIESQKPTYEEYQKFNKPKLDFLIEKKIIFVDEQGVIRFVNKDLVFILNELYQRRFIDIRHLKKYKSVFQELINSNYVVTDDSLFSKYEAEYLNYYLNNSQFTNALALRNNYEHPGKLNKSEKEFYDDYVKGLKILSLIIIKINDELCMRFESRKTIAT